MDHDRDRRPRGGGRRDERRGEEKGRGGRAGRRAGREGGFGPYGKPAEDAGRKPRPTDGRAKRLAARREPDARDGDERPRKQATYRLRGVRSDGERRKPAQKAIRSGANRAPKATPTRRRRRAPSDVEDEVLRLGGTRGPWLLERLMAAADAFGHDRDREAVGLLRPVRDALPDAPSVRELTGLAHYRLGNYRAATKELEEFVRLTDSVEQHPVLMDALRAQRRWRRVDQLWEELAAASPSAELVTEGRIVAAGALADQGRLEDAMVLLRRKAGDIKSPRPHHLRLWYALADLEERAGNLAHARSLFARVHAHDDDFTDVATRLRALA